MPLSSTKQLTACIERILEILELCSSWMANLKTRRQARVKELAELKLQGLVKLKQVVIDDSKRKL
jgi:hypothetical protein